MKIGTHNSATGEKGTFLSNMFSLFSKCQNKTIREQFDAGCRYFDIRVKLVNNDWKCAHGLWVTKRKAIDILEEINDLLEDVKETIYVSLTLEDGKHIDKFIAFSNACIEYYNNIMFTTVNIKKPNWTVIKTINVVPVKVSYKVLDGSSFHTYIPIPILWKRLYNNKVNFNNDVYTIVDFL